MMKFFQLLLVVLVLFSLVKGGSQACRDRFLWPFSSESIWNHPVGASAKYSPASLFSGSTPILFFTDRDYPFRVSTSDPRYPWYDQGFNFFFFHCF